MIPSRLATEVRSRWNHLSANFGWSRWVSILNSPISRLSMAVPIVGYLVLFNDSVIQHLSFQRLIGNDLDQVGISSLTRLKLVYFGLLFLGVGNLMFFWFRPHVLRLGANSLEYSEAGLKSFVLYDYIQINDEISQRGHASLHGKYYTKNWDDFIAKATGEPRGSRSDAPSAANWALAKSLHEDMLRSMLRDKFLRYNGTRRVRLAICVTCSLCGYVLLAIPSVDIFFKVIYLTFLR
jgi:hypothetical protein